MNPFIDHHDNIDADDVDPDLQAWLHVPPPVRLPTASRPGHEDLMEPKTNMMMINDYGHLGQH